jgi:hypothetical protein
MGVRIVPHIAIGTVAHRVRPEIPLEELLWIEMLEEMLRVKHIPIHFIKKSAGLFDIEHDSVIIDDRDRFHGAATGPLYIRMFPEIDGELNVVGGERNPIMPPDIFAEVKSPLAIVE